MHRTRHARLGTACLGALAMSALPAAGESFLYQGRLEQNGQSVSGVYDLRFTLYQDETGGTAIATDSIEGVAIDDGLFAATVIYPDGTLPEGRPPFIEISLRQAGTGNPFTVLSPRQFAGAAPYALRDLDEPWERVNSTTVRYGNGDDVALINRQTPVAGNEHFGVGFDGPGIGGMYVQALDPAGIPFYGYSVGSGQDVFHYYEEQSDEWVLFNGGPAIVATGIESVDVAGVLSAADLAYSGPQTRYYSITPFDFVEGGEDPQITFNTFGLFPLSATTAYAPVHLPDGARLVEVIFYYTDNSTEDLTVSFLAGSHGGSTFGGTSVSSASFGNASGVRQMTLPRSDVIDNQIRRYHIQATFTGPVTGPLPETLSLGSVVIRYEVDGPG